MKKARGSIHLVWFCLLGTAAAAQDRCAEIPFEEPARHAPLTLEQIEGEVLAARAGHPELPGHVADVCLALFRARSKTRVGTTIADREGTFRFETPGVGEYVLIAKPLHQSSEPVRLALRVLAPATREPERGLRLRVRLPGSEPAGEPEIIADLKLRRQLLERVKIDQAVRLELIRNDITKPAPELAERMKSIDAETDAWLKQIVHAHGWPGIDRVGLDGASAASTMLMHVPADTQKLMLPLVEAAFKRGTVAGSTYAMLFDHVSLADGQAQRYGTVAKPFTASREVMFFPIEDEAAVDARRAQVGLPPLAEYRELLEQMYLPKKD